MRKEDTSKETKYCMLLAVSFLLVGCNYERNKMQTQQIDEPWFRWIQRNIIEPKCIRCHQGPNAPKNVDLSSYTKVMESETIIPFKPDDSRFYTTIESGSMPLGGSHLGEFEIQKVREWIEKGAPESASTPVPTPTPIPTPTPTPPPPPPSPTFSWINEYIFKPKCVSCHQGAQPKGDTDFSSYQKLMDSEGITLKPITPLEPEASGVCERIITEIASKKMPPPPSPALSGAEIKVIEEWIRRGANKN